VKLDVGGVPSPGGGLGKSVPDVVFRECVFILSAFYRC